MIVYKDININVRTQITLIMIHFNANEFNEKQL